MEVRRDRKHSERGALLLLQIRFYWNLEGTKIEIVLKMLKNMFKTFTKKVNMIDSF